ncbi:MAG: pruA, partial [Bacteroidota bacterium]|nr:pruA [Bacteroidota bacterium]
MATGFFKVPVPFNEPVKSYIPGSAEREELKKKIAEMRAEVRDIPMFIGGKEIRGEKKVALNPPHDHKHLLGHFYKSEKQHVTMAIEAALAARDKWISISWEQRAAIFLKAAELIAGPYRAEMNAATM